MVAKKERKIMHIKESRTIELSDNDIREIITEYLTDRGFVVTAGNVEFQMGTEYRDNGYGTGTRAFPIFTGCVITT